MEIDQSAELGVLEEIKKDLLSEIADIEWSMRMDTNPRSEVLEKRKSDVNIRLKAINHRTRTLHPLKTDMKIIPERCDICGRFIRPGNPRRALPGNREKRLHGHSGAVHDHHSEDPEIIQDQEIQEEDPEEG